MSGATHNPLNRIKPYVERFYLDVQRHEACLDYGARQLLGIGGNMYRALDSIYKIATLAVMVYLIEYTAIGSVTAVAFAALLITGAEGLERLLLAVANEHTQIVVERKGEPGDDD